MDRFSSFAELEKNFKEGIDFRIKSADKGGKILILTPHGGGIERGTSELARSIAGNDLSLYIFEGLLPTARESNGLHITSTRFDEPRCLNLICKFERSVVVHGCNGKEPMIYVGGKDVDLKDTLITELSAKGFLAQLGVREYAGTHSKNICNRTSSGKGVQLEISNGLRRTLFDDWRTRKSRKVTTEIFASLVSSIRETLELYQ